MHTVELLPDPELDTGVRDLWDLLLGAGLPSLATHRHPTNRPHLTLITARSLTGLPPLPLPLPVRLGPARLLGKALVREVTPTAELTDLHLRVFSALSAEQLWPPPPDWLPHLSLALNVPVDRRDAALHLLAALPPAAGQFVAARSYDTDTRTVTDL